MIEDICLNFWKAKNKFWTLGPEAVSFGYDKILSEKGGAVIVKNKLVYFKIKKYLISNPVFLNVNLDKKV